MPTPDLPDITKAEAAIVEMTNAFRHKNGLAAVKPDPKLANAAIAYARYMARTGTFAHDADSRQPGDRVATAGYRICYVAENLALNQSSAGFKTRELARQMVEGWINSPGHRKNMLSVLATDTAVAIAKAPDRDPKYIAVQLFGRPQSLAIAFQISNATGKTVSYTFGGKAHELKPDLGVVHNTCAPGTLAFQKVGSGPSARRVTASFEASDGKVYLVKQSRDGKVTVDVSEKERAE